MAIIRQLHDESHELAKCPYYGAFAPRRDVLIVGSCPQCPFTKSKQCPLALAGRRPDIRKCEDVGEDFEPPIKYVVAPGIPESPMPFDEWKRIVAERL